jgi:TonB-linked SusC/RagA family outer membrane protein
MKNERRYNKDPLLYLRRSEKPGLFPITKFVLVILFFMGSVSVLKTETLPSAGIGQNQPSRPFRGKVVDSAGEPLAGAIVQLKGSTKGVIVDPDGMFEVQGSTAGNVFAISLVGMETREITFDGQEFYNIVLQEKANELDDVTIVAFARQKKESVVASITTVKASDLKVPSSNLTTAFAGKVAGLISFQQSGEPGADNANFFIRGITTFGAKAKKDPLILIDGIELSTDDLARLNTDDIASFSIMKDANATALYGARGANGVILVTTKEGKEGKVSVNARIETSVSTPTSKIKRADPITYMRMQNEAIKTRDPMNRARYSEEKITMTAAGRYPDIFPSIDWYGMMLEDQTVNHRANVSINGGGQLVRYYIAANITKDNGNIKVDNRNNYNTNINLIKYSVRSNINLNLTKSTELFLKISASFDEYTGPLDGGTEVYRMVMQANPVQFSPYYAPDENYANAKHILYGNYRDENGRSYVNPYAQVQRGYKEYSKNTMLAQLGFKQNLDMITKGLQARGFINVERYSEYDITRTRAPYFYSISSYNLLDNTYELQRLTYGDEGLRYNEGNKYINSTFYLEGAAEYQRTFDNLHNLNALLVYTMREHKRANAGSLQLSLPYRNIGLAGRLAYNYADRYMGEVNFGYNGSERFAKNNRWGFFPSAGLGWMVSNEKFFEPLNKVFSQFKLRATYGMAGNDQIGDGEDRFYYMSEVDNGVGIYTNWGENLNHNPQGGGYAVNRYANDKIGWEKSYKLNTGFEFSTRFGLSAILEYFHEKRENILLQRVIPATTGITQTLNANLGKAKGQGFDMELNYEKSFNKDLWVTARGTFTYATSKVLEWEEPDRTNTPWLSRAGKSVGQSWGYIAERLFLDEREIENSPSQFGDYMAGDIKYRDINGDGKITELDRVPIGFPTNAPEINYGFGLSAGYKGFDLSFFFQGAARHSFYLEISAITPFHNIRGDGLVGENAVLQTIADNYWSENNQDPYAFWPRLDNGVSNNNSQGSTWWLQDGSYLRLKSMEIGYSLPQNIVKKMKLGNARFYISGTNLARWSSFKLWDPELGGNGLNYPLQRVFNFGLNLNF